MKRCVVTQCYQGMTGAVGTDTVGAGRGFGAFSDIST